MMPDEILERLAKTESSIELMMDMQRRVDQKIDTVLQMQIQIASMQESARNHAEKIEKLFDHDSDKENRVKILEAWVARGKGVLGVFFVIIIPVTGWVLTNAYQQINAIDRRLLGIEYQIRKPVPMGE